jgi:hypothetical protein
VLEKQQENNQIFYIMIFIYGIYRFLWLKRLKRNKLIKFLKWEVLPDFFRVRLFLRTQVKQKQFADKTIVEKWLVHERFEYFISILNNVVRNIQPVLCDTIQQIFHCEGDAVLLLLQWLELDPISLPLLEQIKLLP